MRNPPKWTANHWLWSVCIGLPVFGVYLSAYIDAPMGWVFTGFVQYDQPSYMAFAREYFDYGFALRYGLPFSAEPNPTKVYFQPQTFLLGLVTWLTGWDPGIVYAVFGILSGILMFRVAVALLYSVVPQSDTPSFFLATAFAWGGGLLWLPGVLALFVGFSQITPANFSAVLFAFDPAQGYWFQNLGRNTYFAIEAYYHALFLLATLLALTQRWFFSLFVAVLLSASHPWSGIQLLLILAAFSILESLLRMRETPPVWYTLAIATLMAIHLGYYLFFLGWASPEHREVQQQWLHDWSIDLVAVLFGYAPIGVLAMIGLMRRGWRECLADRTIRFLLVWFLVSLALMKHDVIMSPIQPAHFTRGYAWIPLFLLASQDVANILKRVSLWKVRPAAAMVAVGFGFLVVSDNVLWFGQNHLARSVFAITGTPGNYKIDEDREQIALMRSELRTVFRYLEELDPKVSLVVSKDPRISYLATVYTPLRAWRSHLFSTPHSDVRRREIDDFFASGEEPPAWREVTPFIVVEKVAGVWERPPGWERQYRVLLDTGRYAVLTR